MQYKPLLISIKKLKFNMKTVFYLVNIMEHTFQPTYFINKVLKSVTNRM